MFGARSLPCVRGGGLRKAQAGGVVNGLKPHGYALNNPSVKPSVCQLPLHRGAFNR